MTCLPAQHSPATTPTFGVHSHLCSVDTKYAQPRSGTFKSCRAPTECAPSTSTGTPAPLQQQSCTACTVSPALTHVTVTWFRTCLSTPGREPTMSKGYQCHRTSHTTRAQKYTRVRCLCVRFAACLVWVCGFVVYHRPLRSADSSGQGSWIARVAVRACRV
jgi:hypothetical protein